MKKAILKAVIDEDVEQLLTSLQVYDLFIRGEAKCVVCGDTVKMDNFFAVIPNNNEIGFCCSKPDCYMEIIKEKG